jgi:hypothetical protein
LNGLLEGLAIKIVSSVEILTNKDERVDSDFWTMEPYRNPALNYEKIGSHLALSQYGASIPMNDEGIGTPIYRMNEIHNMLCDLQISKNAETNSKDTKGLKLAPRDILFNRTNSYEWVGRTGIFLGSEGPSPVFASYLVRFRTKWETVLPEYLTAFLNSQYGVAEIKRRSRQSINQTNVNPEEVKEMLIPLLSMEIQTNIQNFFKIAFDEKRHASQKMREAERVLLAAFGLADWTAPEPLTYGAKASDALAAGRLDARFFAPRIQALLNILSADGRSISDVAKPRREKFRPEQHVTFDYIEISDMDGAGATDSTRLIATEAPSRATWHVRPGDIITSSVRPIRRLSAEIMPEQAGFVCSSGFVVVNPQDIAPEVLLTYLRLPVICELLDLYASASMYPAITDADIFNLPMPELPDAVATQIVVHVQIARAAKARAAALLHAAKRAVEIAIEDSEAAVLAYLVTVEGAD